MASLIISHYKAYFLFILVFLAGADTASDFENMLPILLPSWLMILGPDDFLAALLPYILEPIFLLELELIILPLTFGEGGELEAIIICFLLGAADLIAIP